MTIILKTLVGSRAHGLANDNSDYDYRGVFIEPTSKILSLNYKPRTTNWIEGSEDQTSYEIGHFLSLAIRSNPSILEVLVAPVIESNEIGEELRNLFPYIWNSTDVYNAFCGYSHNQQKKFLDAKDDRPFKYAVAYIRVLMLARELLTEGTMTLKIELQGTKAYLSDIKKGIVSKGNIINTAYELKDEVTKAYKENPAKQTDYEKVNEFLLKVRKKYW